jgi:hypothetical protein
VIDNLVACLSEVILQELAEFEASVVCGDMYAHSSILEGHGPG